MKKVRIQTIIASGVLAGVLGGMFALAASHMGQKDFNRLRFEGEFYQKLHRRYFVVIGAGLGFALGAAQSCIIQLSKINIDPEQEDT
ncbi:hypothetical protein [Gloeomargarita lithophora]|uniref:hypothetical protein n=1 Tax=Gloeomargarita lithophora TaxID=1188228 RepID=UPI0008F8ECD7|nr:hypothetical protein [Gloeomargarita lithophora]